LIVDVKEVLVDMSRRERSVRYLLLNAIETEQRRRVVDVVMDVLVEISDAWILDKMFSLLMSKEEDTLRRVCRFFRMLVTRGREVASFRVGLREFLSVNYERNDLDRILHVLRLLSAEGLGEFSKQALKELPISMSEAIRRYREEIRRGKRIEDVSELRRIIERGESPYVEFKERLPGGDELAKEVIAFANGEGGIVLIGVKDDGNVVGVDDVGKCVEAVENYCRDLIEPRPNILLQSFSFDDRKVVAVGVAEGTNKPYWHRSRNKAYVRYGLRAEEASRNDIINLVRSQTEVSI